MRELLGVYNMIKAVELRKGRTILFEGELCVIHDVSHVAKGNKRSYMQAKIKRLKSGAIVETRFRVDDQIEIPFVESKNYEYLYQDGDNFIVMDLETYDQVPVSVDLVGEKAQWLKPNQRVSCDIFDGQLVSFGVPHVVELNIVDTTPVVKGATATNQSKEAILETGVKVRVPPFLATGEAIRVDTRTGEYVERAK